MALFGIEKRRSIKLTCIESINFTWRWVWNNIRLSWYYLCAIDLSFNSVLKTDDLFNPTRMNNKKILFWVLWIYDVQDELLIFQSNYKRLISGDSVMKTIFVKRATLFLNDRHTRIVLRRVVVIKSLTGSIKTHTWKYWLHHVKRTKSRIITISWFDYCREWTYQ